MIMITFQHDCCFMVICQQVKYDVPVIIRQMKNGRKFKDPEAVLASLVANVDTCKEEDAAFVRKATGRWLMAHAA